MRQHVSYTISPYITYISPMKPPFTCTKIHHPELVVCYCGILCNIVKLGTPYKRDDSFYRPLVPELLVAQMLWLFRVRWS